MSKGSTRDDLLNDQETAVALSELLLEGLIEFRGEDEVQLTNKGIDYAWDLYHRHTPKEMFALTLFHSRLDEVVREKLEEGK